MAGYVIRQPGHPLLSGCKFLAVGNNATTVAPIFPFSAVANTGTVSGGATVGTLTPFPCINGDGVNNLVTFGNFDTYFGSTARDLTVMGRFKSNSSHIGGVASARNAALGGWQMLFSNGGVSETGYNFAVFGESKFVEAQDGIGAATQTGLNVFACGTWDNTAKQVKMWTRQPADPVAVYRNVNTNTNAADVNAVNWDVRTTVPTLWLEETGANFFFNGDLAWLAIFDRVLSQSEIEQWSVDENWPFTVDISAPSPFFSVPRALNHPVNMIRHRLSMLRGPDVPPSPPAVLTNQVQLPMFFGGPLKGPWRRGPASLAQANPVPTPPIIPPAPQIYPPIFTGGPLRGPWQSPVAPQVLVATPPSPVTIAPQILAPTFRGGPLKGPWGRGGPHQPIPPVPPPPPAPPPVPAPREYPFFDIDAGKEVNVRLRRHTQKLSTALNSLIRQGILRQTADVDWTIDVTNTGLLSGPTGTFTDTF